MINAASFVKLHWFIKSLTPGVKQRFGEVKGVKNVPQGRGVGHIQKDVSPAIKREIIFIKTPNGQKGWPENIRQEPQRRNIRNNQPWVAAGRKDNGPWLANPARKPEPRKEVKRVPQQKPVWNNGAPLKSPQQNAPLPPPPQKNANVAPQVKPVRPFAAAHNPPIVKPFFDKNGVLYKNGKPYTGMEKGHDGRKLVFYKRGKQSHELVPSPKELKVYQGELGDCSILAQMVGILASPQACARIEDRCSMNSNGDLVLNLNFLGLGAFVNNKESLKYLKSKGINIHIGADEKCAVVIISKEKLASVIEANHTHKSADRPVMGVKTNSLFIIAMEHLVGNLLALKKGRPSTQNAFSLLVFNAKEGPRDLYHLVATLLNYRNVYSKYGNVVYPKNAKELLKYCEEFDAQKIGSAYRNDRGLVVVSLDYGKADEFGKIHGRHALTLNKVVRDVKSNEIVALELLNPWGPIETFSVKELLRRKGAFKRFAPQ